MADKRLRVACLGVDRWSDVLADAMRRSDRFEIVSCHTRPDEKRRAVAKKYGCAAAPSHEAALRGEE